MSLSARVSIDLSGFKSVVSEAKTRRVTMKGLMAGVRILQIGAAAAAPRRSGSGALKAAQGVLVKKGRKGTTISYAVQGARKRVVRYVKLRRYKTPQKAVPAFYDHLVLGGTQAHSVAKHSNIRKFGAPKLRDIHSALKEGFGIHPGAKANPYRKRAWEAVKTQVAQVTLREMGVEMQKVIARSAIRRAREVH